MSPEHLSKIRNYILERAEEVQAKLPQDQRHPKGRNAIAHFYSVVNAHYGSENIKEIPDCEFDTVMKILYTVYVEAENPNFSLDLLPKVTKLANLDEFFQ